MIWLLVLLLSYYVFGFVLIAHHITKNGHGIRFGTLTRDWFAAAAFAFLWPLLIPELRRKQTS